MRRPGLLFLLLVAGCSSRDPMPADAYRNPFDRLRVALGLNGLFGQVCYRNEGGYSSFIGMRRCYRLGPPRRMRGVWRAEFEGSEFFPGRTTPPREDERSPIYLSVGEDAAMGLARGSIEGRTGPRLFVVDFVGRRTLYSGYYAELGVSRDFEGVDRLISARPLPQP